MLDTVANNGGWKSLIATRGNRKRMLLVIAIAWFSQWSGNGLVSFYLNQVFDSIGITNPTIQLLINGSVRPHALPWPLLIHSCSILAIWNLCWAVLAALLVERTGRRLLFNTSTVGMLIFFIMQTVCSAQFAIKGTTSAAHAVIAFIFLYYAAYE